MVSDIPIKAGDLLESIHSLSLLASTMTSAVVNGFSRASSASWASLTHFIKVFFVFQADFGLVLYNLIAPKKAPGKVTICGGSWPKYTPPTDKDSRCSCPALNALANHGNVHSGALSR